MTGTLPSVQSRELVKPVTVTMQRDPDLFRVVTRIVDSGGYSIAFALPDRELMNLGEQAAGWWLLYTVDREMAEFSAADRRHVVEKVNALLPKSGRGVSETWMDKAMRALEFEEAPAS